IMDYAQRTKSDGSVFFSLILQGGIQMVQSKATERYYATLKKASITCTFDEETCKASIGEKFPGSIQKQSCAPYSFVVKDTGEILELDYRWAYLPEGASMEEAVFEGVPEGTAANTNQAFYLR
ncbi:MAG: hypothetical protein WCL00_11210, partial [Bacteroidota bacterium]